MLIYVTQAHLDTQAIVTEVFFGHIFLSHWQIRTIGRHIKKEKAD